MVICYFCIYLLSHLQISPNNRHSCFKKYYIWKKDKMKLSLLSNKKKIKNEILRNRIKILKIEHFTSNLARIMLLKTLNELNIYLS